MKQVYRIEVQAPGAVGVFKHWIGAGLKLVPTMAQAVPCTHEEHLQVMESLNAPAVAYREEAAQEMSVEQAEEMDDDLEGTCETCGEEEDDCECGDLDEEKMQDALFEAADNGALDEALEGVTDTEGIKVIRARTFSEVGLLTRNKGVVLTIENAKGEQFKFHLTIVQDRR